MSTNSDIIIQRPGAQEFAAVYCHWDGYPSHNGRILRENYTTHDKVVELISLGWLSELHSTPDACVSYHRWRGEPKRIRVSNDVRSLCQESYSYLFRDGAWWYLHASVFRPLTEEVCEKD